MEGVWPWLTTLPSPSDWPSTESPLSLLLATTGGADIDDDKSIILQAERTAGSDTETLVTFSITILGFSSPYNPSKTLWLSNPCPLSSPLTHYSFLLQLAQEVITLAPSHTTILPSDELPPPNLEVGPIADVIDCSGESAAAAFLTLTLICRLFWLCAVDAPADAGFLFFSSVGPAVLDRALRCSGPAMRMFLTAVGPDWEERFMRSVGYMLAKWCILRELQVGPTKAGGTGRYYCPSYVANSHGLWTLKGYAPISSMSLVSSAAADGRFDVNDSVLRYALAHHQLEAVIQLEYHVSMRDPRFIRISVRVDNVRIHVVRLGFVRTNGLEEVREACELEGEKHFPSRVRIWAGPEFGSAHATGLSLGRSTGNPERETEMTRIVKGNFVGNSKFPPSVKAKSRTSVRLRGRSWRWEQEADGNAGVFEGVLCDAGTGAEVAAGGGGGGGGGMKRRYSGGGRVFSKSGGVVVGGDEMGEGVSWRVGKEMEGRVLRWRVGGRVWVSYYPDEVKSEYFETRCVEWREYVDLPLIDCQVY